MEQYVVVYDISDPARWRKVYKILKNYGYRVQYSVFEVQIKPEDALLLKRKLQKVIHSKEDSVYFYRQCNSCLNKVERFGKQYSPFEDDDYYFI